MNPDLSTIERLQRGDKSALEAIFKTHYENLVGFAVKYLGSQEDAESAVQDVFLKLWNKGEELTIRTTVKSYLFGAVRNTCLNQIKHRKVEQSYTQEQVHLRNEGFFQEDLEFDELQEKIAAALEKLPEKCRAIYSLSRDEGMKYKEIAETLDISVKTVENQMGKALKILREELSEYLPAVLFFWII